MSRRGFRIIKTILIVVVLSIIFVVLLKTTVSRNESINSYLTDPPSLRS